jgi:hypothetical protein
LRSTDRVRKTDRQQSPGERAVASVGDLSADAARRHSSHRSRRACPWATWSRRPRRPRKRWMRQTQTVSFPASSNRNADTSRLSICWNEPESRCRSRTSCNEIRKSAWRKGSGTRVNLKPAWQRPAAGRRSQANRVSASPPQSSQCASTDVNCASQRGQKARHDSSVGRGGRHSSSG